MDAIAAFANFQRSSAGSDIKAADLPLREMPGRAEGVPWRRSWEMQLARRPSNEHRHPFAAPTIGAHAILLTYTAIALFPVILVIMNSFKIPHTASSAHRWRLPDADRHFDLIGYQHRH